MMSDDELEIEVQQGDGEIKVLLERLEQSSDSEAPLPRQLELALEKSLSKNKLSGSSCDDTDNTSSNKQEYSEQTKKTISMESAYGHPLSPEEAAKRMPLGGEGGLIWHSLLINGEPFDENGKLRPGLNPRDFDAESKIIKPRRASLPILSRDFYSSLTRIEDSRGQPRFIFHGVLNGWPSLQTFEVIKIQRRRQQKEFVHPVDMLTGQRLWAPMWSASKEGKKGADPTIKEKGLIFRISFQSPTWSREGWSEDNPGFTFWYESQCLHPKLTYGLKMIERVDPNPKCTHLHMVAHRYARGGKESPKDKLTYHSLVLLEWDHGQYCSVVEAAYLNGLAGWRQVKNRFFLH